MANAEQPHSTLGTGVTEFKIEGLPETQLTLLNMVCAISDIEPADFAAKMPEEAYLLVTPADQIPFGHFSTRIEVINIFRRMAEDKHLDNLAQNLVWEALDTLIHGLNKTFGSTLPQGYTVA